VERASFSREARRRAWDQIELSMGQVRAANGRSCAQAKPQRTVPILSGLKTVIAEKGLFAACVPIAVADKGYDSDALRDRLTKPRASHASLLGHADVIRPSSITVSTGSVTASKTSSSGSNASAGSGLVTIEWISRSSRC
jgi:hypothetical protein